MQKSLYELELITPLMVDDENIRKIEQLTKKIESSEGWKIEMGTRNLGTSYYIFITNYDQLKKALELFDRDEGNIWAIKNRDKFDLFQTEVIRLFHNYLSSVRSLVEHARIVVNEVHGNGKFLGEYKLKVKGMFGGSNLSYFMQDMRNYILHKGIPSMMAQKAFSGSIETNFIFLDLSALKAWNRWSKEGRKYLNSAKGNINLYEIIVNYGSLVIEFYNWFLKRQEQLYKMELEQTQKLKNEYNKIVLKIFPGLQDEIPPTWKSYI
jgi:hypothetical protein